MSTPPDPNDTFELILDPTDIPMPPTGPSRARVSPRASDWKCVRCGATRPASETHCDHGVRPPTEEEIAVIADALGGGTPRKVAAAECDERDEHLAFTLRDVADLVAVHKLTLPDALREVADRIAPKR